jgi:hypothetical protein
MDLDSAPPIELQQAFEEPHASLRQKLPVILIIVLILIIAAGVYLLKRNGKLSPELASNLSWRKAVPSAFYQVATVTGDAKVNQGTSVTDIPVVTQAAAGIPTTYQTAGFTPIPTEIMPTLVIPKVSTPTIIVPSATGSQLSNNKIMVNSVPAQSKIGRLIYIKNGDIYNNDLETEKILVKCVPQAKDKLSWSPRGNLLAFRSGGEKAERLIIYDRSANSYYEMQDFVESWGHVVDYAWSPDEEKLMAVSGEGESRVNLINSRNGKLLKTLFTNDNAIRRILWPGGNTLIIMDTRAISQLTIDNAYKVISSKFIAKISNLESMMLSPHKDKLLYSVGDSLHSDLYLYEINSGTYKMVSPAPSYTDMGTTGLPANITGRGFTTDAVWFPSEDKLLVGYHYVPAAPLSGIYDLKSGAFTAVALFPFTSDDIFTDDLRLLGARYTTLGGQSVSNVSLFTLEDGAKFSVQRVIPGVSSPAFYTGN